MDRERKRRVWSFDLLSVVSAIITIASFLGMGQLPDLAIPLAVVGLAFAAVAFLTFTASGDLRTHKSHVLPFGLGTLERAKDGSTWMTEPVAQCPLCPEHFPGIMHVIRTSEGPQWMCTNSPQHSGGFDSTQMPELLTDENEAA